MKELDQKILGLLENNEEEAIRLLFYNFYRPLVVYALQYLDRAEDAEDLVQNVFISLWEKGQIKNIRVHLRTYLYTTVRNAALNWLKSNARSGYKIPLDILSDLQEEDFPDESDWDAYFEEIYKEMSGLDARTQAIFKAIIFDNKKYKDIAGEFNISINTLKSIILKTRTKLRHKLSKGAYFVLLLLLQ